MTEHHPEELRIDSMKSIFPEYEVVLTDFVAMVAGLLPEGKVEIYDNFMHQEGYIWNEETNTYVRKPGETEVKLVQWLF